MKSILLAIALALQLTPGAVAVVPPGDVQKLLEPILNLRTEAQSVPGDHQQASVEQSGKLIAGLIQVKSKASDEALVVLMNFYVGESLQQDLIHEVTVRGKRMLPLLLKYRSAHVRFSKWKYPSSLLLADGVRKEDFENAIKSVKAGKIFGEE